ncbi:MAG: SAM-dependent DNA methyltransferase, partial [Bacillota bacterium]
DRADQTSAWITARRRALQALKKILGNSSYTAHAGSFTGGANGIYWVEIIGTRPGGLAIVANITEGARRRVPSVQAAVEMDLLYPLLRGRDVDRWKATPSAHILMTQDPVTRRGIATDIMVSKYPKAHSYLARFEEILRNRAAFRRYFRETDPYWSMFNVSGFTFAPWKVVWREQASTFTCAVIGPTEGRPVVPDHKLMLVDVASSAEAYYLCGMLNSAPTRLAVMAYAVEIQMDTHVLENVAIPKFLPKDKRHLHMAELSEAAHRAAAAGDAGEVNRIEEEIDRLAAQVWGLSDEELAEIKQSLEEA